MNKHQFLWFDCETTGLDPLVDIMLEWALVLCEDAADGELAIVEQWDSVIQPHEGKIPPMVPFVRDMHTRNGLLDAIAKGEGITRDQSDQFLAGVCESLGAQPRQCILAGSSVHFDLAFCRFHLLAFAGFLSHRVFDVSTLKLVDRTWGNAQGLALSAPTAEAHRALPDILHSIEYARIWKGAWQHAAD